MNRGKHISTYNSKKFGSKSFNMTQSYRSTTLSTVWITVKITNSNNANITKTFISSCKL